MMILRHQLHRRLIHLLVFPLLLASAGCTNIQITKTALDGSKVQFNATSLFSNTTLKGLGVESSTKTTSNLLKLSTGQTEPNAESITASGAALGELIGTAAKTAVKP